MKKNVGGLDRQVRILLGAVLLLTGLFMPMGTGWQVAVLIVAAVAFITAITGL